MEVLSSRVLLRPVDFERSFRFYAKTLSLHVYREWGSGLTRGVVFFLGGGFLELSGSACTTTNDNVGLWLQVRDVDAVGRKLEKAGVDIMELPTDKPWGLREMYIRDPDGLMIVLVEVPSNHECGLKIRIINFIIWCNLHIKVGKGQGFYEWGA